MAMFFSFDKKTNKQKKTHHRKQVNISWNKILVKKTMCVSNDARHYGAVFSLNIQLSANAKG